MSGTGTEKHAISRRYGKWSDEGVPHRGWNYVDYDYVGDDKITCEMCEFQDISHVHIVEHPDYPSRLRVGCVCAEKLTEDYLTARGNEKAQKAKLRRRRTLAKKIWSVSAGGNPTIIIDSVRYTVFQRNGGWKASLSEYGEPAIFYEHVWPTEADAKSACLNDATKRSTR
jgi:hypothetical protein